MNVLFLTLVKLNGLEDTMVYTDLLNTFSGIGHKIYAICPLEKRDRRENYTDKKDNIELLHANIGGNYFNVGSVEKGITLIGLEKGFVKAIKEHYTNVKFDVVIYTTPPITFNNVVGFIKKRDGALSYLMLKDIFPQNAVDMGMMSKSGIKGVIYSFFRKKEKKLYEVSDVIGCMSKANVEYVLRHNPEIDPGRLMRHIKSSLATNGEEFGFEITDAGDIEWIGPIEKDCILNTCSSVDHDCEISGFVHVAVGAHIDDSTGFNSFDYNINEIARVRNTNFRILMELIREKENYFVPLKNTVDVEGNVPQTFPIIIKRGNRDKIYEIMNDEGYGVVSLYHTMIEELRNGDHEDACCLSQSIMILPVHQDVDSSEYRGMIDRLVTAKEETEGGSTL